MTGILLQVDGTSGDIELEEKIALQFARSFNVFKDRQRKYGHRNISDFGLTGVIVRLNDKIARLKNMLKNKDTNFDDESVADTLLDVTNYGAIGALCLDGDWPETTAGV